MIVLPEETNPHYKELRRLNRDPKYQDLMKTRTLQMDYGHCRDPFCPCKGKHGGPPHHIVSRSQGGLWTVENLITLCSESHHRFHHGCWIVDPLTGVKQSRHTAQGYAVKVLEYLQHEIFFRWTEALEHLKRRAKDGEAAV